MSVRKDCEACENLRQSSAEFIVNGVTEEVCTSLMNDTGFVPSSGHNDCEDLDDANDCLIGNMEDEIDAYEVCDWKEYMHKFIPNVWTVIKAMICSMCGLWSFYHSLCAKLNQTAYVGILTLYRTTQITGNGAKKQAPAFNNNVRQGNMPTEALSVASDYKGIVVNNTTDIPLLIETTFNCSIRTTQHMAACYIVVTKDDARIGQTPFITPSTYDQQVMAEPFILNPGQSATMRYYFAIGDANDDSWFQNLFWKSGGTEDARVCLEADSPSNPENQRSYFSVKATSIMPAVSC